MDWKNRLYFGDNFKILRHYVEDASINLIYFDPPFNSSATYNVLFKEKSEEESAAQIRAFEDIWHWGLESEAVYKEIVIAAEHQKRLRHFETIGDCILYNWSRTLTMKGVECLTRC